MHGRFDFVEANDKLFERQFVDFSDALYADIHTKGHDRRDRIGLRNSFVLRKSEMLLDGDLCVVQRELTQQISELWVSPIALNKRGFDVVADIEMGIVSKVFHDGMSCGSRLLDR